MNSQRSLVSSGKSPAAAIAVLFRFRQIVHDPLPLGDLPATPASPEKHEHRCAKAEHAQTGRFRDIGAIVEANVVDVERRRSQDVHWNVTIEFVAGSTAHQLQLRVSGNDVTGAHLGRVARGDVKGSVNGNKVQLRSSLPYEGTRLVYEFAGTLGGSRMAGDVSLGEYGAAKFTARRAGRASA